MDRPARHRPDPWTAPGSWQGWTLVGTYFAGALALLIAVLADGAPAATDGAAVPPPGDAWQRAYHVTNTFLVGIAALALIGAFFQARAARDQAERMLQQSTIMAQQAQEGVQARRAAVFQQIEARWSSDAMLQSRRALYTLGLRYRDRPTGEAARLISAELDAMRADQKRQQDYAVMMRVISLFETIGLLVRQDYVLLYDIWLLLGTNTRQIMPLVMPHIANVRREFSNDRIFLEAQSLAERFARSDADFLRQRTQTDVVEG